MLYYRIRRVEVRGEDILALRERLGVSQETFALACGLYRPKLCRLESPGPHVIDWDVYGRIVEGVRIMEGKA